MMLQGIGVSRGRGIGRAVVINMTDTKPVAVGHRTAEEEKARLQKAVDAFISETERTAHILKTTVSEQEAAILEGHLAMLADPLMLFQMNKAIDGGFVAETAVAAVCKRCENLFSEVDDEETQQKAADIRDIQSNLIRQLTGVNRRDLASVPPGTVLVAKEFTPSMVSRIKKENIAALVAEIGGVNSHSAILLRAMGIPAVLSVKNAVKTIADGDRLLVDGTAGNVFTALTDREAADAERQNILRQTTGTAAVGRMPNTSRRVYGNIGKAEEIREVLRSGGDGVGLFRTEYLFMNSDRQPTEEEQFAAYAAVGKAMDGKEVIVRTLDIGGEKMPAYLFSERERNPLLGVRGIRFCLKNTALFKRQLRAILRAAYYGNLKMMLPFITAPEEVGAAKALAQACADELDREGTAYRNIPIGVMIETPSAALISDQLAKEADFFSIGTNDLTGYIMAADRGNAAVGESYDVFQPAVQRAVEMTIQSAKAAGIKVGMCGEAAADARLIPHLMAWGLDVFSVTPSAILQTRKAVCACERSARLRQTDNAQEL